MPATERIRQFPLEILGISSVFSFLTVHFRAGGPSDPISANLLLWPARAMQVNESYCTRWAERFDCVLADEFQDVKFAQFTWLRLLAEERSFLRPESIN